MMQYAIFARPVVTIYDLPQTTKQSEAGLVSTIGDEGLYGQACQVRTAPGGVTAEGVPLSPEVAEVVTFYGYHGFVRRDALKFVSEDALRAYLPQPLVLVGRATDVLSLPKVQGVRMPPARTTRGSRGPHRLGQGGPAGWPHRLCPGRGAGAGAV